MGVAGSDPLKVVRVLVLTKYGRLGASSRLRSLQYLPWLQRAGLQMSVQTLLADEQLQTRYHRGGYAFLQLLQAYVNRCKTLLKRHQFDLLWIEKEALPWWPLWMEQALLSGVPYILDYDDAIFHKYDQHAYSWVRRMYGRRLDGLMANAALVVGGNSYLAQRARNAGAPWVEVLPTVIDLERYPLKQRHSEARLLATNLPRIVWIGSPSTVRYLQLLREPLQSLAKHKEFVLRVVGGGSVAMPGVRVEILPWSESTEVEDIGNCDVGVMPLLDSDWERGKCGYKLIQYMACGLPVVASNVGVNSEIVQHGVNGFLAARPDEWEVALGKLLQDKSLSTQMGLAGRQQVERSYCIQKTASKFSELLHAVARAH